jgi:hypothetical protein
MPLLQVAGSMHSNWSVWNSILRGGETVETEHKEQVVEVVQTSQLAMQGLQRGALPEESLKKPIVASQAAWLMQLLLLLL